jgi:hypothetical protein
VDCVVRVEKGYGADVAEAGDGMAELDDTGEEGGCLVQDESCVDAFDGAGEVWLAGTGLGWRVGF